MAVLVAGEAEAAQLTWLSRWAQGGLLLHP